MQALVSQLLAEIDALRGSPWQHLEPDVIPCSEVSDDARLCKAPLVSVLMITYNHEAYLRRAIEGVLAQKADFAFELIIGEDCSADQTRAIALEYQQRFPACVRVLVSEANVGVSANALRCARRSRGRYLAYCEGDDFWIDPLKLQIQADHLEAHAEVGLVHTDANRLDVGTGRTFEGVQRPYAKAIEGSADAVRDLIERNWWVITCTAMCRRDLFYRLTQAYPEVYLRNRPLCDTMIWVGGASISRCSFIPRVTATYVLSSNSASRPSDPRKQLLFYGACLEAHLLLNQVFAADRAETCRAVLDIFTNAMLPVAYQAGLVAFARQVQGVRKQLRLRRNWRNGLLAVGSTVGIPYAALWFVIRGVGFCTQRAKRLLRAS